MHAQAGKSTSLVSMHDILSGTIVERPGLAPESLGCTACSAGYSDAPAPFHNNNCRAPLISMQKYLLDLPSRVVPRRHTMRAVELSICILVRCMGRHNAFSSAYSRHASFFFRSKKILSTSKSPDKRACVQRIRHDTISRVACVII